MANGIPSVVNAAPPMEQKKPKPISGETRQYLGADGKVAMTVKFGEKTITITKWGDADITRTIMPGLGNVRKTQGDMHQIADLALDYFFAIRSDN